MIHTIKGFGVVNEAEIDVFLEFSCFFFDPMDVGNLISGSSAFSKTTLNKASGGNGIPVELIQILKDDAVKELYSVCEQIWKTAMATGLEKVSFHSNPKGRQYQRTFKLPHSALISQTSKRMFKILQARLQQYMNQNFQMFKLDLEKAEETKTKFPTFVGSSKKQEVLEKHLLLLY